MITANLQVFKFYLAMMDSFSEYLSKKYPEGSLDNPDHHKSIIIQKIVKMFHTLERLAIESHDEVSARSVLRSILDSVTVYCFIYEREDKDEVMFRHLLYLFDGLKNYQKTVADGFLDNSTERDYSSNLLNQVISQIEKHLSNHPYLKLKNKTVNKIVKENNWKYKSLQDRKKVKFGKMYQLIGFDEKTAMYLQDFLSQFAHGLLFSNYSDGNSEQMVKVLYESIPIADRLIRTIYLTFHNQDLLSCFIQSNSYKAFVNNSAFNFNDLCSFTKAIIRNDKTLLID